MERDQEKRWKRPRRGRKVSGCGGQLTGGSGLYCAAASLEGNRGVSADYHTPTSPNPDCHPPYCSLRLPHLSLSSPVPILAALFAPARKLRGLTLRRAALRPEHTCPMAAPSTGSTPRRAHFVPFLPPLLGAPNSSDPIYLGT